MGRNGTKEADATGSMALHSLCERRRGAPVRCRHRRRRIPPDDLWWNAAANPFLPRGFLSRLFAANASHWRILRYSSLHATCYLRQRARDLSRRRAWKASTGRRYLRAARSVDLYYCEADWNHESSIREAVSLRLNLTLTHSLFLLTRDRRKRELKYS